MKSLKEFKQYRKNNGVDDITFWKLMQFFVDIINSGKMTYGLQLAIGQEINIWNKILKHDQVGLSTWLNSEINQ